MFGYLSDRIRKIKPLLYIGFSIMLLGNLVYVFTGVIPFGKKYLILITRFTTGFGLSYTSLLRAYAVAASIPADRSKAIAYVTGGMTLGSFVGPALQLIFTPLGRLIQAFFEHMRLQLQFPQIDQKLLHMSPVA
uniref:Major facilitator superfamily (MFS) profile domain-containing protein n=1 Tax=Panagrolaimus sp. ES5 TaxID=591445 RepID=A0AC34G3Q9_9BILA